MRLMVFAILVAVAALFIGLELRNTPGTVLIDFGNGSSQQFSLRYGVLGLAAAFLATYVALRLLGVVWRSPRSVRRMTQLRRERKARNALADGMLELTQGHWLRAERLLGRSAGLHSRTAVAGYLNAARAAHQNGAIAQRDRYLALAQQRGGEDNIALAITEADILADNQQLDEAAKKLRSALDKDPRNKLVLERLQRCYWDAQNWNELSALIPVLERNKVLSQDEVLALERTVYGRLLSKAAQASDDSRALDAVWSKLPHGLRRDKTLLALYIRFLVEHGEGSRPESILRHRIRSQWDDDLVYMYGFVESGNPSQQLLTAEKWLKHHADNPILLLTLGRLSLRNHLWGKARSYLEQSGDRDPRPETFMLLGRLLEQTGENAVAGEFYRKGLGISVNKELLQLEHVPAGGKTELLAPATPAAATTPLEEHDAPTDLVTRAS